MDYIELRFETSSNIKEFIEFSKYIAFPSRFRPCCNRMQSILYINSVSFTGTTNIFTNNRTLNFNPTVKTPNPFDDANLINIDPPLIEPGYNGYTGMGKSYIRNFPYCINSRMVLGNLYPIYQEYILENNSMYFAREFYSNDTLVNNASFIRPVTSYSNIVYSARTDIESPITFERRYQRFGSLPEYESGYNQQNYLKLYPNTLYIINTLPESSNIGFSGHFRRDKMLAPANHIYTTKSTGVCNQFVCENVNNYSVKGNTFTHWEVFPTTPGTIVPCNPSKCEYTYIDVLREFPFVYEYTIFPEIQIEEMIISFSNRIKNGKI